MHLMLQSRKLESFTTPPPHPILSTAHPPLLQGVLTPPATSSAPPGPAPPGYPRQPSNSLSPAHSCSSQQLPHSDHKPSSQSAPKRAAPPQLSQLTPPDSSDRSSLGKPALAWFPLPSSTSQQARQPHGTLLTPYTWLLSEFITALMLHFSCVFVNIFALSTAALRKGVSWTKESLAAVLGHPSLGVHAGATTPRDRPNH